MPNTLEHLTRAQDFLAGRHWEPEALTRLLPTIVREKDARLAYELIVDTIQVPDITQWLPEALMLFNVEGLTVLQTAQMNQRIFGLLSSAKLHGTNHLIAQCNAKLGRIGFSFPIWRYVAKQFNGKSLFECFGLIRPTRESDRYQFGPGFVWHREPLYIEYRQAYILCSNQYCTLLIRNSSFFFGRDKLRSPVYVSPEPLTTNELHNLTDIVLERKFTRWQNLLDRPYDAGVLIRKVLDLLNTFDQLDKSFFEWLISVGFSYLVEFLQSQQEQLPVLAAIQSDTPPWFPKHTLASSNPKLLENFFNLFNLPNDKIVLLSESTGDFPYSIKT